ncbi:MAG: hypothetical protein AAGB34_01430 [Planctomycetota bacterium]
MSENGSETSVVSAMNLQPGTKVRLSQTIAFGQEATTTTIEGEVLRVGQQATGSWFAHMPDDKLWLDRIELRKVNGELVKINIDRNTVVEVLSNS